MSRQLGKDATEMILGHRERGVVSKNMLYTIHLSITGNLKKGWNVIKYQNLSNESGVTAYEIFDDGIRVQFLSKDVYYYSYAKPGKEHVEEMKKRAQEGRGLATYISQNIRKNFDHKETDATDK